MLKMTLPKKNSKHGKLIFIKGNIAIYFSKFTMIPFRWKTLNKIFSSYFNSFKSFCEMTVKCPDIWYFCLSFTSSSDCASTVQLVISLALPVSLQSYKNIKNFPQNISFFFYFSQGLHDIPLTAMIPCNG